MAQKTGFQAPGATATTERTGAAAGEAPRHEHRTARVIEVIGSSTEGFEDAVRKALEDANATLRGITGAHVRNLSVRCEDGRITEYKVDLKVAFGIERTGQV